MTQDDRKSEEASAIARVATAAREVQAASAALEEHFGRDTGDTPTLHLARFAAAMQELQDARKSFDALLDRKSTSK